jgi:hypothetical protein
VERGGPELADQLEAEGYAAFADDDAAAAAAHHERPGVRPGSLDELFSTP